MDPAIKNQKWKIKAIADHIHLSKKTIPFFALTETHLKSRHFDAEVNINAMGTTSSVLTESSATRVVQHSMSIKA